MGASLEGYRRTNYGVLTIPISIHESRSPWSVQVKKAVRQRLRQFGITLSKARVFGDGEQGYRIEGERSFYCSFQGFDGLGNPPAVFYRLTTICPTGHRPRT